MIRGGPPGGRAVALDRHLEPRAGRAPARPAGDDDNGDWDEILRRAEPPRRQPIVRRREPVFGRRTAVAIALAAALVGGLAASPVGRAVADAIQSVGVWADGEPGARAPAADQQAVEAEVAGSAAAAQFPKGMELRSLLRLDADSATYELFGFRDHGSFCLRLVERPAETPRLTPGDSAARVTDCVPAREVERAPEGILAVAVAYPFFGPDGRVATAATFGFAADSVAAVDVATPAGLRPAALGENAFLFVDGELAMAGAVAGLVARTAGGAERRVAVAPLVTPRSGGPDPAPETVPGPARVERVIEGGAIRWLGRREPRGEALPAGALDGNVPPSSRVLAARALSPDPSTSRKVAVALVVVPPGGLVHGRTVCTFALVPLASGGGGECVPAKDIFDSAPLDAVRLTAAEGDETASVTALASDAVASVALYLADGEAVPARSPTTWSRSTCRA